MKSVPSSNKSTKVDKVRLILFVFLIDLSFISLNVVKKIPHVYDVYENVFANF